MYLVIGILQLLLSFGSLLAVLEFSSLSHGPHELPRMYCYGDLHRATVLKDPDDIARIHAKEEIQREQILFHFRRYKGKEPIHFFIEAGTFTEKYQDFTGRSSILLGELYRKLKALTKGTKHVVEDWDIRNVIAVALVFFRSHSTFYDTYKDSTPEKKNPAYVKMRDLWSEIDTYRYTISHACLNYVGAEKFESSYAKQLLDTIDSSYRDLRNYIDERLACSEFSICAVADFGELRKHIFDSLLEMTSRLAELALFLKVMMAHENGERVIVFAGAAHVKTLLALLSDKGYCNGSYTPGYGFYSPIDETGPLLWYCFHEEDKGCGYMTCPFPRYPYTPPEPPSQCVVS